MNFFRVLEADGSVIDRASADGWPVAVLLVANETDYLYSDFKSKFLEKQLVGQMPCICEHLQNIEFWKGCLLFFFTVRVHLNSPLLRVPQTIEVWKWPGNFLLYWL